MKDFDKVIAPYILRVEKKPNNQEKKIILKPFRRRNINLKTYIEETEDGQTKKTEEV